MIVNDTCPGCVDPNKGQFASYSMGIGGPADNFVPPISYWAQPHPHGGGANTYDIPAGVGTSAGTITGLKPGGGGYVFMMQTHHWGSWVYEIADVDAGSGNITFGAGGFQEARGGSGGCGTGSFYLSHRRELLDAPSEWYLDESASKLYTAVAQGGTPPATLFAPTVSVLFRFEGTQSAPVKNSRVSSLTLRHAAPTYMANYSVGSGGDYSVHRNGAVTMTGTENCTVDHNLFDGVGGNGVWLHAYNRHALVSANEMRNIGENGVGLTGEAVWVDGTGGNQPRHNQISGNLINHLGLYTKQVRISDCAQSNLHNNLNSGPPAGVCSVLGGVLSEPDRSECFLARPKSSIQHVPTPSNRCWAAVIALYWIPVLVLMLGWVPWSVGTTTLVVTRSFARISFSKACLRPLTTGVSALLCVCLFSVIVRSVNDVII